MRAFAIFLVLTISVIVLKAQLPEVEVNLNAEQFKSTLPFDTPFIIKGAVDSEVKKVTFINLTNGDQATWSKKPGIPSNKTFYVQLPQLTHSTDYNFNIEFERKLDDARLKKFSNELENKLDILLKTDPVVISYLLGESTDIQAYTNLRDEVIDLIPEPPSGFRARITNGSNGVLDSEITDEERFVANWGNLLEPQVQRNTLIENFKKVDSVLFIDLLGIKKKKPLLDRIYINLQDLGPKFNNWDLTELSAEFEPIRRLANVDDGTLADLSLGKLLVNDKMTFNVPFSIPDLDEVWEPDAIKSIIKTKELNAIYFQNKNFQLQQLQLFTNAYIRSRRSSTNYSEEEVEELIVLFDRINGALQSQLNDLTHLHSVLEGRPKQLKKAISNIKFQANNSIVLDGSTQITDIKTKSGNHVSIDFGLLAIPVKKSESENSVELHPYYGVNTYLRPINKKVKNRLRNGFGRSFSFTTGMTLLSIDRDGEREGLIRQVALLTGFGFRVTNVWRVGAGLFWYKEDNPSPLIEDFSTTRTVYFSTSIDINAFNSLGKFATKVLGF